MGLITFGMTVNDVDRSIHYLDQTLRVTWREGERGSCSFSWRSNIPRPYTAVEVPDLLPELGQQVVFFTQTGYRLFTGDIQAIKIVEMGPRWTGGVRVKGAIKVDITLATLERRLEKRVVPAGSYISDEADDPWTAGALIADAVTSHAAGSGVVVDAEQFIQAGADVGSLVAGQDGPVTVWNLIEQARDRSPGYVAYVDPDNYLHFEPRSAQSSPFGISDTGSNYSNFVLSKQLHEKANRVHHRIGWEAFEPEIAAVEGDGSTTEFALTDGAGDPIRPVRIERMLIASQSTAEEIPLRWGTRIDENASDATWATGSSRIVMNPNSQGVVAGEVLQLRYRPLGGDVLMYEDTANQAATAANEFDPIYEKISENIDTKTVEDGEIEAQQMLDEYAEPKDEVTFDTNSHIEPAVLNLRPGMFIPINKPLFGVVGDYMVDEISMSDSRGMILDFSIHCISAGVKSEQWTDALKNRGKGGGKGSTGPVNGGGKTQPPTTGGENVSDVEVIRFGLGACTGVSGTTYPFAGNVTTTGTPFMCQMNSIDATACIVDLEYSSDGETWESLTDGVGFELPADKAPHVYTTFNGNVMQAPGLIRPNVLSGAATNLECTVRWKRMTGSSALSDGSSPSNPFPVLL